MLRFAFIRVIKASISLGSRGRHRGNLDDRDFQRLGVKEDNFSSLRKRGHRDEADRLAIGAVNGSGRKAWLGSDKVDVGTRFKHKGVVILEGVAP